MKVINTKRLLFPSLVLAAAGLYVLFWPKQYRLLCPIHALTGLWCPGCGSTRAAESLIRGDFPAAVSNNAMLIAAPVFMLIGVALDKKSKKALYIYLALLLVLVISFTVLRNIPGSSFAPL
ncbi:MAG: DUF2752 domain-containing protein [Rhodoluna sp.]|jgi:hypothetical protein